MSRGKRTHSAATAGEASGGIAAEIDYIYDAMRDLHGKVDRPLEAEIRRVDGAQLVYHLRAFGYREPLREGDMLELAKCIERCPMLCCMPGHAVFFDTEVKSARSEIRGALVVELSVPEYMIDSSEERVKRARQGEAGNDED